MRKIKTKFDPKQDSKWAAFELIKKSKGITAKDLAEFMRVDFKTAQSIICKLVGSKMIKKTDSVRIEGKKNHVGIYTATRFGLLQVRQPV